MNEIIVWQSIGDEEEQRDGRRAKRKVKDKQQLTIEQRLEIASSVFEHVQKGVEETKANSEKLIDALRATLEETDVRIADLKKDAYEFKRDIVVGAENFRTGKTMAEKVVRYMEDKLRQKDSIIEKIRLKNSSLKNQIHKIDAQLKQKEEMGDALHYIDFHQLQIENKQYVAKIEERNQELLKLKMTTGNTVQALNNLKKKLAILMSESEWLNKEIKFRTEQFQKLGTDIERVTVEIRKEDHLRKNLAEACDQGADMPHTLDYIAQKAEMYELQAAIKDWTRKVEIAAITKPGKGNNR